MKIRKGFVSNSSSSSFIIKKENLTPRQLVEILNYQQFCKTFCDSDNVPEELQFMWHYDSYWSINENDDNLEFYTHMDNFSMFDYLTKFVHIDEQYIEY